jgi:hypothetical protein
MQVIKLFLFTIFPFVSGQSYFWFFACCFMQEIIKELQGVGGYRPGEHLFPCRTEPLSPWSPMVLPDDGGRVGYCHPLVITNPHQEIDAGFFMAFFTGQTQSERRDRLA